MQINALQQIALVYLVLHIYRGAPKRVTSWQEQVYHIVTNVTINNSRSCYIICTCSKSANAIKRRGLNNMKIDAYKLKWIAIIGMILNHAVFAFQEIMPLGLTTIDIHAKKRAKTFDCLSAWRMSDSPTMWSCSSCQSHPKITISS